MPLALFKTESLNGFAKALGLVFVLDVFFELFDIIAAYFLVVDFYKKGPSVFVIDKNPIHPAYPFKFPTFRK